MNTVRESHSSTSTYYCGDGYDDALSSESSASSTANAKSSAATSTNTEPSRNYSGAGADDALACENPTGAQETKRAHSTKTPSAQQKATPKESSGSANAGRDSLVGKFAAPTAPLPAAEEATSSTESHGTGGTSSGVELCSRDADIWGKEVHHLQHHWLKTANVEAGMGPASGEVPGHGRVDLPFSPTMVVDHEDESLGSDVECVLVENVDIECVERELELGKDLGRWAPWNHCQSFVRDVISTCETPDEHPYLGAEGAPSQLDAEP